MNTYGYVLGNPLYWTDRYGLNRDISQLINPSFGSGGKVSGSIKGPSGRVSSQKYMEKQWDKGTFGTTSKSIRTHVNKHGKGLSPADYTQRAVKCFNNPNAKRHNIKDRQGRDAIVVNSQEGRGVYTHKGKILTFTPRFSNPIPGYSEMIKY